MIRVPIPDLNEERRRELTRVAAKYAEEARVLGPTTCAATGSRCCRRRGEGGRYLAGPAAQAAAATIQHLTDDYIQRIDEALAQRTERSCRSDD